MRTSKYAALAAASLVFVAGIASAARPLVAAGAGDQVPQRLAKLPMPTGEIERKPVSFSWALDPAAPLSEPEPFLAESREYWKTVDAGELSAGVALPVSAKGALIRVSPARGAAALKATQESGQATIIFTPPNVFGILDHRVTQPDGSEVYVPMRAIANGVSTEVIFTLFCQPGMDDATWARDEEWVKKDLERLKRRFES